jgi:hypothetical protein
MESNLGKKSHIGRNRLSKSRPPWTKTSSNGTEKQEEFQQERDPEETKSEETENRRKEVETKRRNENKIKTTSFESSSCPEQ